MDKSTAPIYYVGIGASAGGLEALEAFFTHMPADNGMAFIVIQHLSPDYKSMMVELLSKRTGMQVRRAEEGLLVEPNHVYLIPPKKNLTIFHGKLLLNESDHAKGINLPIDVFFRSLADDQAEKAVGIILSGTGSDGVRGVRAIKEAGGMLMVQSDETARFDGMPRAAVSTGLADFILPPEEMPQRLLAFARQPYATKAEHAQAMLSDEDGMARIFSLVRERTRVDFTFYKPSTVVRRIERRMTVNLVENIREYVHFMEAHPVEVISLYRELLIGVTSFFRDREVFDELETQYLPDLIRQAAGRELRLWVAGCSTGEEAYSMAIMMREVMESLELRTPVKIFATDLDRDAIVTAGNGIYPESIAADLSPKLLAKYFMRKGDRFQVDRTIREMVVFAQHNLVKDPPFTNIDLVSCRNLLIYLQPVLQNRVMELFHFSLNPQGVLLLGTSETIGENVDLFETVHHKHKIFRSQGKRRPPGGSRMPVLPDSARAVLRGRSGLVAVAAHEEERMLERYLQLLSNGVLPLSMIVNEQMELLHIFGDPTGFLRLPSGKLLNDVTRLAVQELAIPLATGLQRVFKTGEEIKYTNIRLGGAPEPRMVNLTIQHMPGKKGQEVLAAIFMEDMARSSEPSGSVPSYDVSQDAEQRIRDLEQELQFLRENLQATIEELETSNEELQATNEELLASNEELQSTNEELQSVNEELHTVNAEYQSKIIELTELNNDLDNLMNSTQVGTLFLDENLEIRKFTPQAGRIFKIIPSDVGRPLQHLTHSLREIDLLALIEQVNCECQELEMEVQTQESAWFLMRIMPYQVGQSRFSGVVLTFTEVTQLKKTQASLTWLFNNMAEGVVYHNERGQIISANPAAGNILGLSLDQLMGRTSMDPRWCAVYPDGSPYPGDVHPAMVTLRTGQPVIGQVMGINSSARPHTTWIKINAFPIFDANTTQPFQVYATFSDITETVNAAHNLALAQQEIEDLAQNHQITEVNNEHTTAQQ